MRKQTLLLFKSPNFLFCYGSPRKLKQGSIKDVVYREKSQGGVEERKREGRKQMGVNKSHVPLLDQDGKYHHLLPTALHNFLDQYC